MTSSSYRQSLTACVLAVPAAAASTAWLIGDLSYTGPTDGYGLDHAVEPLLSERTLAVAGLAGLVLLVLALAALLRAPRAWPVLACSLAGGALVGLTYRVATAGVIGANIGYGLLLLVGAPVLLTLLVTAAGLAVGRRPRAHA